MSEAHGAGANSHRRAAARAPSIRLGDFLLETALRSHLGFIACSLFAAQRAAALAPTRSNGAAGMQRILQAD